MKSVMWTAFALRSPPRGWGKCVEGIMTLIVKNKNFRWILLIGSAEYEWLKDQ